MWLVVLLLVAAVAGWYWWSGSASAPAIPSSPSLDRGNGVPGPSTVGPPLSSQATVPPAAAVRQSAKLLLDPIGGAADLKRVFDQFISSEDPARRRIAARAFEACVPAFFPADAQTPSPEMLISGLPAERRADREAAIWSLFARCRSFFDNRAAVQEWRTRLRSDREAEDPGVRAQEDVLIGRMDRIDALVSRGLAASDPAAVAAMSGLAAKLARAKDPDEADAGLIKRALAVDAALPLVACDLGLDCGPASLRAMQLCAVQGSCDGDLAQRLGQPTSGAPDASSIQEQRTRLLALIRNGRPLTAADLLP